MNKQAFLVNGLNRFNNETVFNDILGDFGYAGSAKVCVDYRADYILTNLDEGGETDFRNMVGELILNGFTVEVAK